MRFILFFVIVGCFAAKCHSNESIDSTFQEFPSEINDQECFCYVFGNKTPFYVVATEGQIGYDLYVSLDCKQNWHKRHINESSILEWAFNDFAYELSNVTYEKMNDYNPIRFKLYYINGDEVRLISSDEKNIVTSKEVLTEIIDLRSFLMGIWAQAYSTQ